MLNHIPDEEGIETPDEYTATDCQSFMLNHIPDEEGIETCRTGLLSRLDLSG